MLTDDIFSDDELFWLFMLNDTTSSKKFILVDWYECKFWEKLIKFWFFITLSRIERVMWILWIAHIVNTDSYKMWEVEYFISNN